MISEYQECIDSWQEELKLLSPLKEYVVGVDMADNPAMFPISYRQCQHCHFQADRFYEGTPLLGQYWQLCEKCAKNLGDDYYEVL
jgi:hypothetical protein